MTDIRELRSQLNDAKATLIRQINWLEYNLREGASLLQSFNIKKRNPKNIKAAILRVRRAAAIDRKQLQLLYTALQKIKDKEELLNELTQYQQRTQGIQRPGDPT